MPNTEAPPKAQKETVWKPIYDGTQMIMSLPKVKLVSAACIVTLLLSILDINVVAAVAWNMVGDLDPIHGIDKLPWLTSCYALADCIVVPLLGKLADEYGSKLMLVISLGIFAAGSLGCAVSTSMTELIVFRTVQGLGAGGLTAITLVVTGILFVEKDEDKPISPSSAIGVGAAVMFGVGLALGPTMGGLIAENLNWRWVFYINVPLAVGAMIIIMAALRMPSTRRVRRRIDFLGAALLAGSAACALLVAEWGGQRYPWNSSTILTLGIGALVLAALFIWRGFTAAEPLVSLTLVRNPTFRLMMPISLLAGVGLAGGLLYVSGYLQVGRGLTTGESGLLILCMAVGMLASVVVAKGIVKVLRKAKYLLVSAGVFQALVLTSFGWVDEDTSLWLIGVGVFVLGIGIGQSLGLGLQFIQSTVSDEDMGLATSSLRFVQQLGAAFGFALYSTIVARYLSAHLTGASGAANVGGHLDLRVLSSLPPDQLHSATTTFIDATNLVFLVAAALSLLPGLLAFAIKERSYDVAAVRA